MWLRFISIELLLAWLGVQGAVAGTLESVLMPGPVVRGHAKYETQCDKCHIPFDKPGQARLCLDCHKGVAADVAAKAGYHGRLSERDCKACHTEHKGRDARIAAFDQSRFDHAATDYPLRGAHADPKLRCSGCHRQGARWRDAVKECESCHVKDDVHKGVLGKKCSQCHNENDWKQARFDHDKTRFALRGGHEKARCQSCHPNRKYKPTPRECVACHRQDDQEKGHKGRFGERCDTCHGDRAWDVVRFDHDRDTRYKLLGKHREARCARCHKGILYKEKLKTTCQSCHQADDVHKGSQGPKCESCHSERTWKTTAFEHDRDTKFALRGKHREAKCETCHKPSTGAVKPKLETACVSCHRKDDADKGHKGRYGPKCDACHDERNWKEIRFDHDRDTRYLLRGKHRQVKCDTCHRGRLYEDKLATQCIACHEREDVHKGKLGRLCESCHSETLWREVRYDHGRSTFPLTGSHLQTACKKCHATPLYKDTPSQCVACHLKEDVHKKRLGPDCAGCHNTRSWKSWDYDHAVRARYPLDGAHRKVACTECHRTATDKAVRAPRTCIGCHADNDVHDGGFGPLCERCHTTESFTKLLPGIVH